MDKATEAPPETQNQSWSSPEFEKEFYSALGKDRPEDVPPEFRPGQDPAVKPEDKATPEVKPETAPKTDTPEKIEEEDTETPESLKSGKAAEDWKRMRAAHKDEAAKLKARIKELESASKPVKTEAPPDYEQIKKEHQELSETLRLLEVERHPKFKAYFDSKMNMITQQAKTVLGPEEGEKFVRVMSLPPHEQSERLNEFARELYASDPGKMFLLSGLVTEAQRVSMERQEEITKAKASYDQIQKEKEGLIAKQRSELERTFEAQLKSASEALPVLQRRDGDDKWNQEIQNRVETARRIFNGETDPENAAKAAIWAAAAEPLLKTSLALAKENETLKAELNKLRSLAPDPSKKTGDGGAAPEGNQEGSTLLERAQSFFSQNGIGR